MAEPFLELRDIGKVYPGVAALKGVSLSVAPGEVVGLVGENGAGKSTLMKVLGGVTAPTTGTIRVDGAERTSMTVADAIAAGIAFVHQELNLFDNLDAAANVFIGREPVTGPLRLVDRRRMAAEAEPLFRRLGADFGPDTPVSRLSLAQQQLLEIAKALSLDSRVVIMDEPTSSLTLSETARLLKVIADLKASGVSVIFISHRLDEVKTCADRVVVLRDGQMVGRLDKGEITPAAMIRLMIGRDLRSIYQPPAAAAGEAVLSVEGPADGGLPRAGRRSHGPPRRDPRPRRADRRRADRARAGGLRRRPRPRRHDPARRPGGRDRLAARRDRRAGSISCPRTARPAASSSTSPIAENISLPQLRALAEGGIVSRDRERTLAEGERRRLDIRAPGVGVRVGLALGRQPAEGGAGQVAVDAAEGDHLRRADAGDRRRRQAGDLRHAAAARRPGGRRS